jgi:hypothetical protein
LPTPGSPLTRTCTSPLLAYSGTLQTISVSLQLVMSSALTVGVPMGSRTNWTSLVPLVAPKFTPVIVTERFAPDAPVSGLTLLMTGDVGSAVVLTSSTSSMNTPLSVRDASLTNMNAM